MSTEKFKRVVPWYSMSEWAAVYKLVFSTNPKERKDGLDRMVCWKARCHSLPAAVECTLEIFLVIEEDRNYLSGTPVSPALEMQLSLMYSTAVMRFLNLMLDGMNDDDTGTSMYSKAEKLRIPEWIVNLRHDAAHGTSLPDLFLLQAAANFISKWLHDQYWQNEAQLATDWHVSESDVIAFSSEEIDLGQIMETWEALSLYELAGFETVHQLPDLQLKHTISSFHKVLKCDDEGSGKLRSMAKVSTVLSLVLRRLAHFFKTRSGSTDKALLIAKILTGGEFLLPSENLMKILYPTGFEPESILHQLPTALADCYSDLMSTLWDLGALTTLIKKLILISSDSNETDLRRNIAALWVQKLLLSCLKAREARKVRSAIRDRLDSKSIFDHYKESFPGVNRNTIITCLSIAAVENQRPDLKLGYTWKVLPIPNELMVADLVIQSILPSPKFSNIFLPCLLELAVPTITLETRDLLLDLINLYNSGKELECSEDINSRIFSLSDLTSSSCSEAEKSQRDPPPHNFNNGTHDNQSRWSLSQGHLEWHKCPLGVLPWQREQSHTGQTEHETKRPLRALSQLFLHNAWTEDSIDTEPISHKNNDEPYELRHVKKGRVSKPLLKPVFAMRAVQSLRDRPRLRALGILTSK